MYNKMNEGGAKLNNRLREIRQLRGLTQEELSSKSGVSRTTIGEIESGKKVVVTNVTLEKISNALEVKVTDIFFRD